jgi:hypothetical protein
MSDKIRICLDNGANIHSKRCSEVKLSELDHTPETWAMLTEDAQMEAVEDWINAMGWLEYWWEPID